jgi:hypothetical protein
MKRNALVFVVFSDKESKQTSFLGWAHVI